MRSAFGVFAAVAISAFSAVPARACEMDVLAVSNLFGAGHSAPPYGLGGSGILPPTLPCVDVVGGSALRFSIVKGTFSLDGVAGDFIPDGLESQVLSTISSTDGISGTTAYRVGFLAGVFLGPSEPAGPGPTPLDFTSSGLGTDFETLESLQLGQIFYIGDGWTGVGTGVGSVQTFIAPAGATRLFLGFVDAYGFNGPPGAYGDNTGGLRVRCQVVLEVPAPSNIFGSGHASAPAPGGGGAGTLPPRLGCIEVTGGSELSFHDIGGTFTLDPVAGNFIPDGLLSSVVSTVQSFEGISGTTSDRVGFLAGVFLTDDEPTVAPTPLDFSSSGMGTEFPSLESLEIGQTFYIGDGWTGVGTGVGSLQTFIVPAGATRLFLGFLDAQGFNSVPGYYGDNAGALSVCISMCENAVLNVREEPMGTALASPWPDPARSAMSVRVWIDRAGRVDVDALDLAGRRVREIASGEVAAGGTTWVWDLRDAHGRRVPAGVYVVRARTPEGVFTRRATVIR